MSRSRPEILLPVEGRVRISACSHPFAVERVDLTVEAGLTIAGILEVTQAEPALRRHAAVYVGDHFVPRELWRRVRPKPGSTVAVRVVPHGGDSKTLRTILLIAVAAAAIATGQIEAIAALGPLAQGAVVAAVGVAGSLAVNALVPLAKPKLPDLSGDPRTSGFLSGAGNRLDIFGVVPRVLGRHRMTPPFAVRPYTEVAGDDQFLRALLCWGYGPLTLPADLKIGETAIEAFDEVELEHVQGFGPDPRPFLPADVDTAGDRIAIAEHGYLDDQAVEVVSDTTLPGGLAANPQVFAPADVNAAADRIALPGHGFANGQPVEFMSSAALPGGLKDDTRFYVVNAAAGDFQVSTAPGGAAIDLTDGGKGAHSLTAGYFVANATAGDLQLTAAEGGAAVGLTSGGAGTHRLRRLPERITLFTEDVFEAPLAVTLDETFRVQTTQPETDEISFDITFAAGLVAFNKEGKRRPRTVIVEAEYAPSPGQSEIFSAAAVNAALDTIDLPGHSFAVGQIVDFTSTGALPAPLAPNTDYVIVSIVGDAIKISPTEGVTAVDLADGGTGSHTVTQHDWSASALGKVFASRRRVMGAPPKSNRYRFPEGESYTTRVERIDRIVMDRFSGQLTVLRGRAVETAVISGVFPRFDPQTPDAPRVSGSKLKIARVRRRSDETVIANAVITDERDPDSEDPEFGAVDFIPTESSPRARSVDIGAGTLAFAGLKTTAAQASPLRRSLRFQVPQRGRYDVRLRRTTAEAAPGGKVVDQVVWTALRSIAQRNPVKMTGLAMTALRIKATDQLTGNIPPINGIVDSILPDWDGTNWVSRPTGNPASIFRAVLQGPANARPLADGRIDLAGLQVWHEKNTAQGFTFNQVIDFPATVLDTLAETAAAGRAGPTLIDGRWGVVIDEPQSVPVQHFTPRNSWGFSGERAFLDLPHGFRVRFVNAGKDWRQDERIVTRDGFSVANATKFEGLELPGITDPELVWRHARFHLAQAELRPEVFSWFADLEAIVCTRGDLVLLTHDLILVGLAAGRIKQVIVDAGGNATQLVLDEAVPMEAGKSYGLSIRKDDGDNALTVAIDTNPGAQTTLTLTTPIPAAQVPAAGQLFGFGETGLETLEVIVKAIEPGADLSFRITAIPAAPAVHRADDLPLAFLPADVDPVNDRIVKTEHGLQDYDLVSVTTDGTLPGGLIANPQSFLANDVDDQADRIAVAGHGLVNGQVVLFTSAGKLPGGLRPGQKYFVVGAAAGDFQVAATKAGTPVDLADPGSGAHQVEASYVVANASAGDFTLRAEPAGTVVNLTSGGAGNHTAARLIPPFDSRVTPPPGIATPAVEQVLSDGSVLALQPDGSYASRILATLLAPAGLRRDVAVIECQFRESGTDRPYVSCPAVPADAREVSIAPVEDGETYEFRLRYAALDGSPGPWGPVIAHTVLGKSAPPADVTGFNAQQNGPVVTFSWTQVPDLDLQGYEIRFGPPGITWADADPLTQVTRGTRITTASVPPGSFDFHIRAKDNAKPGTADGGNFSANSAVVQLTVTSALDVVEQRRERPAWTGTLVGFVRNPLTGDLNPESTQLAAADVESNENNFRGQDVFDDYVWQPVAAGSYEAPEIALDFTDQVRAWADVQSVLGPGETGLAAPVAELDAHSGAGYDGFELWTIGELEARFFKFRVGFDFTRGLVRLQDFKPTVDLLETELRGTVTVSLGGRTIVFAERFHNLPQVIADAEATGGALRFVRKSNVTETGFDATVVDSGNQDVGGTMTYSARGV